MPSRSDLTSAVFIFKASDLPRQQFSLTATYPRRFVHYPPLNDYETIMSLVKTKAAFMSSLHFAIVGASKDQTKVGTKVRFMVLDVDYMRLLNAASR
jgi:hypothetical protein